HPLARGAQHGFRQQRRRSLALRARDVDRGEARLRIPHAREQTPDRLEPQAQVGPVGAALDVDQALEPGRGFRERALRFRAGRHGPASDLLDHVAFPLPVVPHRFARAGGRRVVELQRVAAHATDLVGELEAVDFARRAHDLAVLVPAAGGGVGWGHDPLRVLVARCLLVGVADDVPHDAVVLRVGVLLADVASDSPQLAILAASSPERGTTAWSSSARRGVRSRYAVVHGGPSACCSTPPARPRPSSVELRVPYSPRCTQMLASASPDASCMRQIAARPAAMPATGPRATSSASARVRRILATSDAFGSTLPITCTPGSSATRRGAPSYTTAKASLPSARNRLKGL